MATPARHSNQDRLLSVSAVAAYAAATFVGAPAVLVLAALLAAVAIGGGLSRPSAWAIASFGAIACALNAIPGFAATWPLPLLVALVSWVLLVRRAPEGLVLAVWFPRGRPDRVTWTLPAAFVLIASVALVTWFRLTHPDVEDIRGRIPHLPMVVLILVGVGFSLANALAEELVYRGILFGALERTWGAPAALVMQAAAFGLAHTPRVSTRLARRCAGHRLRTDDGDPADAFAWSGGAARRPRRGGRHHLRDPRDDGAVSTGTRGIAPSARDGGPGGYDGAPRSCGGLRYARALPILAAAR